MAAGNRRGWIRAGGRRFARSAFHVKRIFRISEYLAGAWRLAGANQPDRPGGGPSRLAPRMFSIAPAHRKYFWQRQIARRPRVRRAGFLGLVLACALAGNGRGATVTLIEKSPSGNPEFLEAAIREVGLPARVLNQRAGGRGRGGKFDLVTARPWPLCPDLLGYAHDWLKTFR